jgi:VIT1/CCC1 family predicted Fe2+/Mn2+ transporter
MGKKEDLMRYRANLQGEIGSEEEQQGLELIYEVKGLTDAEASKVVARVMADREHALDILSREKLGIDPEVLGGSAWAAGGMSFALFAVGAILPVVPFPFLFRICLCPTA